MSLERRELFRILGAGLLAAPAAAQHQHAPAAALDLSHYQPRFFTAAHYETLDRLCSLIIPSDEHSPGAHETHVPYYIDTVLHYAEPSMQTQWRNGIQHVDAAARTRFDRPFHSCTAAQQDQIVADMARHEAHPETDLEQFFGPLKRLTIEAYCLSAVAQKQHFGYRGDVALAEFPGCTHPEHQ